MAAININSQNFYEEVIQSDKKVLLDFWAPWCGPCNMLGPILEDLAKDHPEVEIGKVNVDEQMELANQFGVMSIPTLVVLENGKIISKSMGAKPKKAILNML